MLEKFIRTDKKTGKILSRIKINIRYYTMIITDLGRMFGIAMVGILLFCLAMAVVIASWPESMYDFKLYLLLKDLTSLFNITLE